MRRRTRNSVVLTVVLAGTAVAVLLSTGFVGGSGAASSRPAHKAPLTGPWRYISDAPHPVAAGRTAVWTGREMIVAGTNPGSDGTFIHSTELAEAYDPASNTWRELAPPPATPSFCRRDAVWTGSEMLVWGCDLMAYDPATNDWRRLPDPPTRHGIAFWTGHELIGWGGGCCGDASDDGSAYDPETSIWRKLAPAPISGQQSPAGAWTGRELIILSGQDPDGNRVGGAAYDPASDTWRTIASLPASYDAASAVSFGGKVYAVAAGSAASSILALDLERNTWKGLGAVAQTLGSATVARDQLVMLGGEGSRAAGLAYFFRTGASVPFVVPRPARGADPALVWTGRELLVWGGTIPARGRASSGPRYLASGLAFRPRKVSPPLPQCCGG